MLTPRSFLVSRQNQRHSSASSTAVPKPPHLASLPVSRRKDDKVSSASSSSNTITAAMPTAKRKGHDSPLSPSPSPPSTTTTLTRPPTPTSPVRIPLVPKSRDTAHPHKQHRYHGERKHRADPRPGDVHSPDAVPASVAALLAVTSIPTPKSIRTQRQRRAVATKRMTVESIIEQAHEAEKEFSLSLVKSPLDLLLSAPEDMDGDTASLADSNYGSSPFSTRTVSMESMPSLDDSFTTSTLSSVETPFSSPRSRKSQPTRKSLTPVSSPPSVVDIHPLSEPVIDVDDLDLSVFDESPSRATKLLMKATERPLKSAFKSNLTASLRALRQAARSFSSLNFSSIPPEDFLTRSILTIDPQVPYTDERRPQLEGEPTAAVRRYLNPTTNTRIEQPSSAAAPGTARGFTASIQMQTYKVKRAKNAPSPSARFPRMSLDGSGPDDEASSPDATGSKTVPLEIPPPGPRQREMRENSDFIRIAVMEMAMRKRGKLDDQRPGRARWALPPRKTSTKPYEVREDGVPARWVSVTY